MPLCGRLLVCIANRRTFCGESSAAASSLSSRSSSSPSAYDVVEYFPYDVVDYFPRVVIHFTVSDHHTCPLKTPWPSKPGDNCADVWGVGCFGSSGCGRQGFGLLSSRWHLVVGHWWVMLATASMQSPRYLHSPDGLLHPPTSGRRLGRLLHHWTRRRPPPGFPGSRCPAARAATHRGRGSGDATVRYAVTDGARMCIHVCGREVLCFDGDNDHAPCICGFDHPATAQHKSPPA